MWIRSVATQPWLDHKADQRHRVRRNRWKQARSDVEPLSTDCTVKEQPHGCSRGPQYSNAVQIITFVAGARPGAGGPQTLAANADVELNQPVCK